MGSLDRWLQARAAFTSTKLRHKTKKSDVEKSVKTSKRKNKHTVIQWSLKVSFLEQA